ncbi:hypothetical protein J7J62_07840 [bacterium]|nr:hypothetical protein [bacterium]
MKIGNGIYFVFLNGKHILTKKVKDNEGKNYFPSGIPIPLTEFTIEEKENKIMFIYKHLPFYDILEPISKAAFKGKIFSYGKEWFDFILIKYEG